MHKNNHSLPLNALRAFETAARHMSFTRAAEELSVTQGAVSRHIKGLEEHLELALFRRRHRMLELTEDGRYLLQGLSGAFEQIEETVRALGSHSTELNIKAPPTLAVRWLIPRLHRFETAYPDIPINLTTAWMCFDPDREHYDAGIGYESDIWPEKNFGVSITKDPICEEWMTPVCAPGYLSGKPPLTHPENLKGHTLLNCKGNHGDDDWVVWADRIGLPRFNPRQMLHFDFLDIALNAAAAGQGIALGDIRFVKSDIETGRLITPLDSPPQKIGSYFFISRRRAKPHPGWPKFRDWLLGETSEDSSR